ncbi:MAG TPA: hypothetical protein VI318_06705 [Baekduia sp.]
MNLRRLAPAIAVAAAVGALIPAAGASAATPTAVPSLPAFTLPAGGLPALGDLPAFTLPAGFTPSLFFQGPQVAIGPTVIGSVFNGGTSVVVANEPPVNSGNVIGSP